MRLALTPSHDRRTHSLHVVSDLNLFSICGGSRCVLLPAERPATAEPLARCRSCERSLAKRHMAWPT